MSKTASISSDTIVNGASDLISDTEVSEAMRHSIRWHEDRLADASSKLPGLYWAHNKIAVAAAEGAVRGVAVAFACGGLTALTTGVYPDLGTTPITTAIGFALGEVLYSSIVMRKTARQLRDSHSEAAKGWRIVSDHSR
jgi:hypothetical protein